MNKTKVEAVYKSITDGGFSTIEIVELIRMLTNDLETEKGGEKDVY